MKKPFFQLGLVFAALFALSGVAYSQSGSHVGSSEWMGDTLGYADGPDNGRSFLDCGSGNYITKIKFRRYRRERDADYYTFAVECRTETSSVDPDAFRGPLYGSGSFVSGHVLTCGGSDPIRGIAMRRYRKIRGDYDTYEFAPKCKQPADRTAGPYRDFVGSTRGSSQTFSTAECSRSGQHIMNSFEFQRFRESRRDYDTYRFAIGCR